MRPKPTINRKNLYSDYLKAAKAAAKELSKYSGVVGIVLSGGVSRGFADKSSEIDLGIFLDKKTYREWVYELKSPIARGDTTYNGYQFDFNQVSFDSFMKSAPEHFTKWDLSYGKVLYDKDGKMKKALREKTRLTEGELKGLLDKHSKKVWWFPLIPEDYWFGRGDLVQAHGILNDAIKGILETLFLVNGEYIAYDKWIYNMYKSLPGLPENFHNLLQEGMLIKSFTRRDVLRRVKAIKEMSKFVLEKQEKLPYSPRPESELIGYIFKKKTFTLKEFEKRFPNNKGWLLYEPMKSMIYVKHGKNVVISLKPKADLVKAYNNLPMFFKPMVKKMIFGSV